MRILSLFAGAATALAVGRCILHLDYKVPHESLSQQMKGLYESLDGYILSLENLKEVESS
ncbi:hypothetical protein HHK36_029248 [Tetracentron sinense]|uniref:Uncharacterized protein n=1 Tax=Tetracentron sinense TaxID=13715 RepID=A0A834YEM9_TETSI|nr:hypothetical protein HHK36_029248 [Tetracentron sinense]